MHIYPQHFVILRLPLPLKFIWQELLLRDHPLFHSFTLSPALSCFRVFASQQQVVTLSAVPLFIWYWVSFCEGAEIVAVRDRKLAERDHWESSTNYKLEIRDKYLLMRVSSSHNRHSGKVWILNMPCYSSSSPKAWICLNTSRLSFNNN